MMTYNFDEPVNRNNTYCVKYDAQKHFLNVEDAIPMWVADMDFKVAPVIMDALKKRMEHEVFGYTMKTEVRNKSIVNWLKKRHHWNIEESSINFSPGVVAGFTIAIEQLSSPGDKIMIQPPVYFPFFDSINNTNRKLVENNLKLENGRLCMDFDDLEKKLTPDVKLFMLCNPHNPGGSVWTKDELQRLHEMCKANNTVVISDEIHADIIHEGHTHFPFAKLSDEAAQNSVTIMSHSKTFNVAGLTTSYVVIPNTDLMEKYQKALYTPHLHMGNIFGTEALIAAYDSGEEWLGHLLKYLQANINFVADYFAKHLPKLKVIIPESTFLIWVDCRELNMTPEEISQFFLHKAKVSVNEGSMFGENGKGFVRLNIGTQRAVIEKALSQIREAYKQL